MTRSCASIGLVQGGNCNQVAGGLDVGCALTTGVGRQDITYGGNSMAPALAAGLDGIPDIAFYNTVNPTKISQKQYNGRLDANVTSNDKLAFAIFWVPVTNYLLHGPNRSQNRAP